MTSSLRLLALALLLAAPAGVARAQGTVLAPGPGSAPAEGAEPEPVRVEDPSWKLCEVKASLLATAPGRSIVAQERTEYLYLGEDLDLSADVTVPLPQGSALVHARARLRAAAATAEGVTYFVASDGVLRSAIGFQHPAVGQDQFRNELLEVRDEGTRLHEIFALPDQGLRVVLVIAARPVTGREAADRLQAWRDPVPGEARRFVVEALMKEAGRYEPLEQHALVTMDGRTAGLSLSRFSAQGAGGVPRGTATPTVQEITVSGVPTRSAAEMGAVRQLPADRKFQERVEALQRSMKIDPTVTLDRKLPGQRDMPATPRKISASKRKKIQEAQRRAGVRDWAIEQSRKLPGGEGVPEGFDREELELRLTPLRVAQGSMQLEIALKGRLKLPKEEAYTSIDATIVEQVRFGEPLELSVAEMVREGEPMYDYVLRITAGEP